MPTSSRPPDSRSSVASRLASTIGGWKTEFTTPVVRRTLLVCAAAHVSASIGSHTCDCGSPSFSSASGRTGNNSRSVTETAW